VLGHFRLLQCSIIPHDAVLSHFFIATMLSHFLLLQYSAAPLWYNAQSFLVATVLNDFLLLQPSIIHWATCGRRLTVLLQARGGARGHAAPSLTRAGNPGSIGWLIDGSRWWITAPYMLLKRSIFCFSNVYRCFTISLRGNVGWVTIRPPPRHGQARALTFLR
jgi:hypothetical protein